MILGRRLGCGEDEEIHCQLFVCGSAGGLAFVFRWLCGSAGQGKMAAVMRCFGHSRRTAAVRRAVGILLSAGGAGWPGLWPAAAEIRQKQTGKLQRLCSPETRRPLWRLRLLFHRRGHQHGAFSAGDGDLLPVIIKTDAACIRFWFIFGRIVAYYVSAGRRLPAISRLSGDTLDRKCKQDHRHGVAFHLLSMGSITGKGGFMRREVWKNLPLFL